MSSIDPVRLEVIRNALIAGAEEMNVSIWRTARSTVVRETLDYSTALFDGRGQAVAQSTRIPIHLNSMSVCLEDIIAGPIPIDDWREGDVILTNDPYSGGQHLPDFVAFKPIFADGRRVAIAAAIVHHVDVGGGAPGSYFAGAQEVYQEGLRLPPLKLVEAGQTNQCGDRHHPAQQPRAGEDWRRRPCPTRLSRCRGDGDRPDRATVRRGCPRGGDGRDPGPVRNS